MTTTTNATTTSTASSTANSKTAVALEMLAAGVAAILDGDQWAAALRVAARMHHYSPNNRLLIMMPRPDATRVAGFGTWKSLGRTVRKGEKGIAILAPCVIRPDRTANEGSGAASTRATAAERNDPAATATDGVQASRLRFRVAYVFDPLSRDCRPRFVVHRIGECASIVAGASALGKGLVGKTAGSPGRVSG